MDAVANTINAVFDDELEEFLKSLRLLGDFTHNKIKCAFCGDVIDWENLHSVFPDSGSIKIGCTKPECVELLALRLYELRSRG